MLFDVIDKAMKDSGSRAHRWGRRSTLFIARLITALIQIGSSGQIGTCLLIPNVGTGDSL